LEDGVSSQVLNQFPSTGQRASFIRQVREDSEDAGVDARRLNLSAMTVLMVPQEGDAFVGIGWTDNLAIVVAGESWSSVLGAFSVVDSEWCCSAPE